MKIVHFSGRKVKEAEEKREKERKRVARLRGRVASRRKKKGMAAWRETGEESDLSVFMQRIKKFFLHKTFFACWNFLIFLRCLIVLKKVCIIIRQV